MSTADAPASGVPDDLRTSGIFLAPHVTPEVEGVGGRIKERDEDFLVEELPLYDPSGEGEHIYLMVEKTGVPSSDMVRAIARHFRVSQGAVGYAGMKDKHAVTRQVVSVHTPGKTFDDFPSLDNDRIRVLWADMHTNKLRVGHLRGNRFSIRIRGVEPTAVLRVRDTVRLLERRGVPNFFGEQRFGYQRNNHELGRLLILNERRALLDRFLGPIPRGAGGLPETLEQNTRARELYASGEFAEAAGLMYPVMRNEVAALRALADGANEIEAVNAVPSVQLKFWISAFQSALFNRATARRIESGLFDRLVPGDVAAKLSNGALFDVDEETLADPETERRLRDFEISPTGPIWGPRTKEAGGEAGEAERRDLRATGVTPDAIADAGDELGLNAPGTRRAMRIPLRDPDVEGGVDDHGPYVRVAFELPPGAYATVVLREITKNDPAHPGAGPGADDAREGHG